VVSSAGVQVEAPLPMCSSAARFLIRRGVDPAEAINRPAVAIDAQMLADSDLVLVADKHVRATVAAMDPGSRMKVFSLRGAGLAARHINTNNLVARARVARARGADSATDLIDGEETLVCLALGDGTRPAATWLRAEIEAAQGHATPDGGHDIEDAHTALRTRHPQVLRDVAAATEPLSYLLRSLSQDVRPTC
jgi:protein-tyrosine-phosphatase